MDLISNNDVDVEADVSEMEDAHARAQRDGTLEESGSDIEFFDALIDREPLVDQEEEREIAGMDVSVEEMTEDEISQALARVAKRAANA